MKCFPLLYFLLLFSFLSCRKNKPFERVYKAELANCDSIRAAAALDYKNKSLKYYYAGIANAPLPLTAYLKKELGIEVKNKGCTLSPNLSCYNTYAEEKIVEKTGKNLQELMAQMK